ncbi:MAG: hypothetical protein ACJ76X_15105 [Solirubrobacteraceae bacterium]
MKLLVALGCVVVALTMSASAAADSLVFIRANNVWLANADGSAQYQVTLDGTAGSPYSSPSQADDGTIVALRTPPGGRPQIWRMHQNGGLLNAPINTPAPGTGATDARVSPNGQFVAYWFITTVGTGTCLYCVDLATRALISHVDRFTTPSEVGTPNLGQWPSWMSDNRLLMSTGAADQWYYQLGRPEAVEWWADYQNCAACPPLGAPGHQPNLSAGEVSRDGQQLAVVRGDSEETIALYRANGAPPADGSAPPIPSPTCGYVGPVGGRFARPTWSQDGRTLAWQEGNGIWSAPIPDITTCGVSQLIVPGGTSPDFGPAAVNPGPRPACGNPGNPNACPLPTPPNPPPPKPPVNFKALLGGLLTNSAAALKRLAIHGLVHKHKFSITFSAPGPGTLIFTFATLGRHGFTMAGVRARFLRARSGTITLTLTRKALRTLRHASSLRGRLTASFTPSGGRTSGYRLDLTLRK